MIASIDLQTIGPAQKPVQGNRSLPSSTQQAFQALSQDTFTKRSASVMGAASPSTVYGGVLFGIRRASAQPPPDPFLQKAQMLLTEWARWKGVDLAATPKLEIDETGQKILLLAGSYFPKTHTFYLNKVAMDRLGISLETMIPHEATHAWYAWCRTRLKVMHPQIFKTTCLDWIKEDTRLGDKTALALQLPDNSERSLHNIKFIQRPYIPTQASRHRVAETLEQLIRTNAYNLTNGQASLTDSGSAMLDPLLASIPDYTDQLTHGIQSEPYRTRWQDLGKIIIQKYLEAQLIRYNYLLLHSTFDPARLSPHFRKAPLSKTERADALMSMKDILRAIESCSLTQIPTTIILQPQYNSLYYLAGNLEEYMAYRNQNAFLLHLLDHPNPSTKLPETLRNRRAIETGIHLIDAAKDYAQAVREFNTLPRNPEVEAKRVGHLSIIPLKIATLESLDKQSRFLRTQQEQLLTQTALAQQSQDIMADMRAYQAENDPDVLMAPSPQKTQLLHAAESAANRMKDLNQQPHYLTKSLLPLFVFPSIQAYRKEVLNQSGVQQQMYVIETSHQATMPANIGLSKFIQEALDLGYQMSYKSGF